MVKLPNLGSIIENMRHVGKQAKARLFELLGRRNPKLGGGKLFFI